MSVLSELKWNYNYNLNRYYKGCTYCEEHKEEIEKWLPKILEIAENIDLFLAEIQKYQEVSKEEILNGFREEEIE